MNRPAARASILAAIVVTGLLAAGTGGAVAGSLVTGAQIEDGTITGADVEDGALTGADLGPDADPPDRLRPGTASGPVARGLWTVSGAYPGNGAALDTAITLPRPAPRALRRSDVLVAAGPQAPAACRGTVARPTAPRGKICVYADVNASVAFIVGYTDRGSRLGFRLSVQGTGQYLNVHVNGSWAYTAP